MLPATNSTAAAATAPSLAALEVEGRLAERDVFDLLRDLRERQWSGTVTLSHMGVGRNLTLQRGRLLAATSTSPDDRVSELLLRRGRITLEQYVVAGEGSRDGKCFEAVLLESGVLSPGDLMKAVVEQAQEAAFGAFDWTEGKYRLAPAEITLEPGAPKIKSADTILEGVRRIQSWARVCKGIGGLEARFARAADYEKGVQQMTLSREASSILTNLAAARDVRTLCAMTDWPAFEVCRTLWAFLIVGLVARVGAATARAPRAQEIEIQDDDGLSLALSARTSVLPTAVVDRTPPAARDTDELSAKRILVVGVARELFEKMEPLLSRASLVVDRVPRPQSALVLCEQRRFDLIVALASFNDIPIHQFLAELRKPQSRCSGAQVILLSDDPNVANVANLPADAARATVLPLQAPARLLDEVAMRVLGVAPRQSQRLMVRVEVQLDQGRQLVMCQTENVSKLGMLLRSEQPFPLGTKLAFDFTPPGDRSSIRGKAEVVRHSVPDLENVHGVGVKIVDFHADGRARWEEFLAKKIS